MFFGRLVIEKNKKVWIITCTGVPDLRLRWELCSVAEVWRTGGVRAPRVHTATAAPEYIHRTIVRTRRAAKLVS